VDDHEPRAYVTGIEQIRRTDPSVPGTFSLVPANQAAGLVAPVGGASGIDGLPAGSIASAEHARFWPGALATREVQVLVVTLTQ
jgi:hypothetical protein